MARYRVLNPAGEVDETREFSTAGNAKKWFSQEKADNSELGWRIEVLHEDTDEWHFFGDSEGSPSHR